MSLKLGSLFSGYGGLDMAVHAAFGDVETVWVSDFDTGPNKILAHRYPNIPNIGDITKIDWSTVEPVDIIAGGFPCQDVSLAGRRAGMTEGTRSNLWGAMRTAIEIIRPRYVVAENVRGLLSAKATSDSDMEPDNGPLGNSGADNLRALGRVLGDLADLGYGAAWCGLRASDVGAPHGRFRVFIFAEDSMRGGSGGRTGVTSDRASERADSQAHRPDSRPDSSGQREVTLLPTPRAQNGESRNQTVWHRPLDQPQNLENALAVTLLPTITTQDTDAPAPSQLKRNTVPLNTLVTLLPTPMAADGMNGNTNSPESRRAQGRTVQMNNVAPTIATNFGPYQLAIERWEHVIGRPAPAPTEPNGKNRPVLSPMFAEWMMGLPPGWVTDVPNITRTEALKALGNGVVPQQGEVALAHLLETWKETRNVAPQDQ